MVEVLVRSTATFFSEVSDDNRFHATERTLAEILSRRQIAIIYLVVAATASYSDLSAPSLKLWPV